MHNIDATTTPRRCVHRRGVGRLVACVLALTLGASACEVPDPQRPPTPVRAGSATHHRYGPTPQHRLTVYRHEPVRGVLVYVHGGGWIGGTGAWESIPDGVRVAALASYDIVSIEYRTGDPYYIEDMLDDVGLAVQWVRRQYGAHVPVVLAGHSAGGFLALHAAARNAVRAVVAVGAPFELDELLASDADVYGYGVDELAIRALGCENSASSCARIRAARYRVADLRSTAVYIAAGGRDPVVDAAWSRAWYRTLVATTETDVWFDLDEDGGHAVEGVNAVYLRHFLALAAARGR